MQVPIDYLIMLCSADWFPVSESPVRINIEAAMTERFKAKCRDLVSKIIGDDENYYLIDFSPARIQETVNLWRALLQDFNIEPGLIAFLDGKFGRDVNAIELLPHIFIDMLRLVHKNFDDLEFDDLLIPSCRESILEVWFSLPKVESFESAASASNSQWDRYLRQLGEDTPDFILYYLDRELQRIHVDAFLTETLTRLSPAEIDDLLAFYEALNPGYSLSLASSAAKNSSPIVIALDKKIQERYYSEKLNLDFN